MRAFMLIPGCVLLLAAPTIHAQDYPGRPIRIIVAYAPGGTTDFTARMIGPKLAEALGQQVVIDNRSGAGSLIGTDFVDGQLAMVFPTMTLGVPQVRAGRLRALAVTSARRTAALPEVPTMTEAGFPAVNATSWFGLVAPAKTPKPVIARLHAEMVKIVKMPDVRERFEAQHAEIVGGTPEALGKFVAGEIAQWKGVAKAGNIKAE